MTTIVSDGPLPYVRPPLVIFGSGGSGTRVVTKVARAVGVSMGVNINDKEDSPELGSFNGNRVNWYLARCHWIHQVIQGLPCVLPSSGEVEEMAVDLRLAILQHLSGVTDDKARWGWKTTPSMLILPFLHQQFPDLKVIHLVRNGLDMAYSGNQNMLLQSGDNVLDPQERSWPEPVQAMLFWSRTNLAASIYGEEHLGTNYLRLRFEDVCATPADQIAQVSIFLNGRSLPEAVVRQLVAEVKAPPTVDRWRAADAQEALLLSRLGTDALGRFGYLPREHATVYESAERHRSYMQILSERAKEPPWDRGVKEAVEDIVRLVPPNDTFILVDGTNWGLGESVAGRQAIPFVERDGQYWGPPTDENSAVEEVERLRRRGASFLVFGWPAFWWLDHYPALRQHVQSTYRCVEENPRLVAFDLRR